MLKFYKKKKIRLAIENISFDRMTRQKNTNPILWWKVFDDKMSNLLQKRAKNFILRYHASFNTA